MKKFLSLLLALLIITPVFADTIGSINYREVVTNYSKAKSAQNEIEDRANELQQFLLVKEKENMQTAQTQNESTETDIKQTNAAEE